MMRVLIIEDERKAANELKQLVLQLQTGWQVVDMIPSAREAIEWFSENKMPDLIFSDIQLADADCFRIFDCVAIECPIIFCTAYDEYAIKAFETNGIDYLLKPIDDSRLKKAVEKFKKLKSMPGDQPQAIYAEVGRLIGQAAVSAEKTLLVHHREKIMPVKYADVAFFYYHQGVVTIKLHDGSSYHTIQTIDKLEVAADPVQFYRANRQYLINRKAIKDIEKFFARKLVVKLSAPLTEPLVVSKAKASDFLRWLEQGG